MRPLFCILTGLACLLPASSFAQYTIKNIVFEGSTPYSQTDLVAASGLKPGQPLGQDGMSAAAQKLADTGAFDDLQVTVDGPKQAITVIFKVKAVDPSKTVHVNMANLVWWSAEELQSELHKRVPLFAEVVPEAGDLQEAIRVALEALVAAKGISNPRVDIDIREQRPGVPYRTAVYAVTSPKVILKAIHVEGASPAITATLPRELGGLVGTSYSEGTGTGGMAGVIGDIFRNAGCLDVSLAPLQRSITATASGTVEVELSTSVQEGIVYRFTGISWAGSPVMSEADFRKGILLKPGEIASQKLLRSTLAPISFAYRRQGYMDVTVDAVPQKDAAARTVAYTATVNPGEIYHLKSVDLDGLPPQLRANFDAAWTLKPGDVYDESYVQTFLIKNMTISSQVGYRGTYRSYADPNDHTVELKIAFVTNSITVR